MSLSNPYEKKVLGHLFRGQSFAAPTSVYAALFTDDTGFESGAPANEITGGGYQRVEITCDTTEFSEPTDAGVMNNLKNIEFPTALDDWGPVGAMAIMEAQNGGDMIIGGVVQNPRTVETGDVPRIRANELSITIN